MENNQNIFKNPIILKSLEIGGKIVICYDKEKQLIVKIATNKETVKKLDEILKDCQTEIK